MSRWTRGHTKWDLNSQSSIQQSTKLNLQNNLTFAGMRSNPGDVKAPEICWCILLMVHFTLWKLGLHNTVKCSRINLCPPFRYKSLKSEWIMISLLIKLFFGAHTHTPLLHESIVTGFEKNNHHPALAKIKGCERNVFTVTLACWSLLYWPSEIKQD